MVGHTQPDLTHSLQTEVAIMKILLEQFADEVTETKPGAQKQRCCKK
jgi:hypothetical protein